MPRVVVVSLGASSLPYASLCISSLAENLHGNERINLLTDTKSDQEQLQRAFAIHDRIKVFHSDTLWMDDANSLRKYTNLERLRQGHYCWRKLTDPMLLANNGDEIVLIDPDVYFPRAFDFEIVGDNTLRLMWQKPNCFLPFSVVQKLFDDKLAMADHVDIGIAQYRSPLDLEWLDWLLKLLGNLPPIMHVEAILWAALAMRMGGGYLSPYRWHCWSNTQWKRVLKKTGTSPIKMLEKEDISQCLAFHAGGIAKTWLTDPGSKGLLKQLTNTAARKPPIQETSLPFVPFVPFTLKKFQCIQRRAQFLKFLGYYKLIGGNPPF